MSKKTFLITLTAAVVFGGVMRKPGDTVECDEATAKNLLHRGRGVLAEADTQDATDDDEKPLTEHTVDELRQIAVEYEIEHTNLKKADLIKAIEQAEAG